MSSASPAVLVVIVDLDHAFWSYQSAEAARVLQSLPKGVMPPQLTLSALLEVLLPFLNASMLLNRENDVAVLSTLLGTTYGAALTGGDGR